MDRKQNKKEYKRSRSRSEKKRKKEKKRKNKDKKRKDKHSRKSDRRHSNSRSSSDSSRSSRSNSPNGGGAGEENKIRIIPITVPTQPRNVESQPASNTPTNAIPSSILQFVNKANQNISTTAGANPLREKRNAFSSPPKNTSNGFGAPVTSGGLEIPGLGGINITSNSTTGGMLDISIAGMAGMGGGFGFGQDTQIIGNKIPPALQKQYIHALRVYIGNIPDPVDVEDVCKFVFEQMANAGGLLEAGNPILSKKHDPIKKFIFLQLRSIEETTACMELDGIIYRGKSLRFRRPKDFGVLQKVEGTRPVPIMDKTKLRIVQTQVENTYNKLQIMNLPENFSEEHVMQLLNTYGDLKSFHLAVDKITSESKGFAFCEFVTDRSTVDCLNRLSGNYIIIKHYLQTYKVNKVINVKRCNPQLAPPQEDPILSLDQLYKNLVENVNKTVIESGQKDIQEDYLKKMLQINAPKYEGLMSEEATNILKLHNIVNKQLIEEDPEFELVFNDLKTQLDRIGRTKSIVIPRKKEKHSEGVGFVFVEFDNERTSQIASYLLSRLKYDGKDVKAEYYSPQYYADKTFF